MSQLQKVLNLVKKYRTQFLAVALVVVALLVAHCMGLFGKETFAISQLGREMIFFSMEGCGHCEAMQKEWDLLTSNYGNNNTYIELKQVVAQDRPDLIEKYGVQGFPTILALKDGKINMTYKGDRSYASLLQFLNNAMTN